ncbi:MAG: PKD domain-containing protein [Methanomassiliicoccaceae archaeon]|nr:PKD domain-containing protein [Methanomassiliicoccaceae archaeon]
MRSKIFAASLVVLLVISGVSVLAVLDGNERTAEYENDATLGDIPSNAIPISTPADLALVGSTWNSGAYPLYGYYYLTNDIQLTGTNNHVPIGGTTIKSSRFTGTFNGNGHIISGLDISNSYAGLFSNIDNSTIINLGIENASISGTAYIGGIVARAYGKSVIDNCYVTGNITGDGNTISTGGIVGSISIENQIQTDFKLTNCFTNCNISSINSYMGQTGGLIGYTEATYYLIQNCYSASFISTTSSNAFSGGIIGRTATTWLTGNVVNCYYLSGQLNQNGVIVEDKIIGDIRCPTRIDGTSDPPRMSNQITGAYSESDMQPDTMSASSNTSIYFMGLTTTTNSILTEGWDFADIWVAESSEYPTLRVFSKVQITNTIPSDPIKAGQTWQHTVSTIPEDAEISIEGADWLQVSGSTISTKTTVPYPPGSGTSQTWDITIIASYKGYKSAEKTEKLFVYVESISNDIPVAKIDYELLGNRTIKFDGTGSSDTSENAKFYWDLGNGKLDERMFFEYQYPISGLYTVSLSVENDHGRSPPVTEKILVADDEPVTEAVFNKFYRYTISVPVSGTPVLTGAPYWLEIKEYGDDYVIIEGEVPPSPALVGKEFPLSLSVGSGEPITWIVTVVGGNGWPEAGFNVDKVDLKVTLTSTAKNATSVYYQYYEDGPWTIIPTYTYNEAGTYTITQRANAVVDNEPVYDLFSWSVTVSEPEPEQVVVNDSMSEKISELLSNWIFVIAGLLFVFLLIAIILVPGAPKKILGIIAAIAFAICAFYAYGVFS